MAGFKLRDELLLGTATAATQIEGGDSNNNWSDWADRGKIKDKSTPVRATDHYRLWREDLKLLSDLNIQTYRFGLEWSRIEPQKGKFDQDAINHYREEIEALLAAGIKPLLTLHHFSNPLWLEKMGGFEHANAVAIFLRYCKYVVQQLGDLVSDYITINEPNVYALFGYFYGQWPPGRRSFLTTMKVMSRLAQCHIRAYETIHLIRQKRGYKDTKVGFAHHMRVFAPVNRRNPYHRLAAWLTSALFQDMIARAMLTGRFVFPLHKPRDIDKGRYYDFLGINYYTRSTVKGFADGIRPNVPVNDLGWEIYPAGLLECAERFYKQYHAPIFITENGTCDNTEQGAAGGNAQQSGSFRSLYIYEHLRQIAASDLPIERYYHWCFCDNFEWIEGESARFGLVHTDFATQRRAVKPSGWFYSQIIKDRGVSDTIYDKYVNGQHYNQN